MLEAFDRIQIRAPEITLDHLITARRSLGLVFSSKWSNRGVNLWAVDQQTIPLIQGQTTYALPTDTVMILDTYLRQIAVGNPINYPNANLAMSALSGITQVGLSLSGGLTFPAGLAVGQWIEIQTPLSVGGFVLNGFYPIITVSSSSSINILTPAIPNTAVGAIAGLASFITIGGSASVTVSLTNHGQAAGSLFNVLLSTAVGGLTLFGSYTVTSVTSANAFVIMPGGAATSSTTVTMNGGQPAIAFQTTASSPIDRILYPISRTDYANLPDKYQPGPPTTYWFDRLTAPTVTLWQVPDANGPYSLIYFRQRQVQDANIVGGQGLDMPARFYEVAGADLAAALAWKYPPNPASGMTIDKYEMAAKAAWAEAAGEDRERVPLNLTPDFSDYFR